MNVFITSSGDMNDTFCIDSFIRFAINNENGAMAQFRSLFQFA